MLNHDDPAWNGDPAVTVAVSHAADQGLNPGWSIGCEPLVIGYNLETAWVGVSLYCRPERSIVANCVRIWIVVCCIQLASMKIYIVMIDQNVEYHSHSHVQLFSKVMSK